VSGVCFVSALSSLSGKLALLFFLFELTVEFSPLLFCAGVMMYASERVEGKFLEYFGGEGWA